MYHNIKFGPQADDGAYNADEVVRSNIIRRGEQERRMSALDGKLKKSKFNVVTGKRKLRIGRRSRGNTKMLIRSFGKPHRLKFRVRGASPQCVHV